MLWGSAASISSMSAMHRRGMIEISVLSSVSSMPNRLSVTI